MLDRCDRPELSLAIDLDGGYHRCCASFAILQPAESVFDMPIADWRGDTWRLCGRKCAGAFSAGSPCRDCSGRAIPANTVIEHAAFGLEVQHARH